MTAPKNSMKVLSNFFTWAGWAGMLITITWGVFVQVNKVKEDSAGSKNEMKEYARITNESMNKVIEHIEKQDRRFVMLHQSDSSMAITINEILERQKRVTSGQDSINRSINRILPIIYTPFYLDNEKKKFNPYSPCQEEFQLTAQNEPENSVLKP